MKRNHMIASNCLFKSFDLLLLILQDAARDRDKAKQKRDEADLARHAPGDRRVPRVLAVGAVDARVREVGEATDERVPSTTCGTGPRCAGAGAHAVGTGSSSSNTDDEAVAMLRAEVCAARHRQVVLVPPEIGEWCSVGGLGTMVDHFSSALASQSAFQDGHVSVIAPAYDCF